VHDLLQEGLRRHVLRVLRVWRDWFIFGDDILNGLQVCLHCNRKPLLGTSTCFLTVHKLQRRVDLSFYNIDKRGCMVPPSYIRHWALR
jgi:hypothetical protein